MDLPLPDIEIIHLQRKKLTYPHARSEKNQNQGPVPDGANNGEKLTDVAGVHGPRKQIRQLQLDLSSEKCLGNNIAFDQKPQEAQEVHQPRPHGCDFRSPILLAFDKGLQIISDDFFQSAPAQTGIKSEEEFNGFKRITKAIRLVVQTPLVAHVALDALLLWKILLRGLLKDLVDDTRFMLIL